MALERWDPFTEMVNRMFGERFARPWQFTTQMGYSLPMDVCEMDDEFLIRAAIPGVRPEDLDISVKEDTLTIKGEIMAPEWVRRQEAQTGQQQAQQGQQQPQGRQAGSYHCWLQEIPYGRFTRSVTLPAGVNGNNARAEFENGLLVLHLPKAEEAKPRRIEVHAGGQRQQLGTGRPQGQQR